MCFLKHQLFYSLLFIHINSHFLQGEVEIIECIYTGHSTLQMVGSHNKS